MGGKIEMKKRLLAIFLVFVLVVCGILEKNIVIAGAETIDSKTDLTEDAEENDVEDNLQFLEDDFEDVDEECELENEDEESIIEELDDTINIEMEIQEKWSQHYNAIVTLTNLTDDIIDNWAVEFEFADKIENIWNAKIICDEGGKYVIKNAEWNQDIEKQGKVTFGITVKYDSEISYPKNISLVNDIEEVDAENYKITYKQNSNWDDYVSGEINIENLSNETIEDWKLEFSSDFSIQQIWNADIVENSEEGIYIIKNKTYNQNIAPKNSCSFGFIAKCKEEVEIKDILLYSVTKSDDIIDEDQDDEVYNDSDSPEDISVLSPDDFEDYPQYLEYIQKRTTVQNQTANYNLRASVATEKTIKKSIKSNVEQLYSITNVRPNLRKYAFQNFCFDKNEQHMYAIQHVGKNAYLSKFVLKKNAAGDKIAEWESYMVLKGFGHTQSLEFYKYNGREYLFMTGKYYERTNREQKELATVPDARFATQIVSVEYEPDREISVTGKKVGKIVGLRYSNKSKKSFGRINRVDIGLNESSSKIVIWKRRAKDGNVEISTIKFSNDMKKKLANKKSITFGSYKTIKKTNRLTNYIMKRGTSNFALPDSMQSIDMGGDNEIFISSGRENETELCIGKCAAKCKDGKNPLTQKYLLSFADEFSLKKKKKELEGVHSIGNKLYFVVCPSNATEVTIKIKGKEKKIKQKYICYIKK